MYQEKEKYVLDFRNVRYYYEIHRVIKDAFDLPDCYGCNFDALWDCLTDMIAEPINVEIIGLENIERRFGDTAEKLLELFEELEGYAKDIFPDHVSVTVIPEEE